MTDPTKKGKGGCALAVVLALTPVILFVNWWFWQHPDYTGRIKLAVTVDANGKTYTGATVYDVTYVWDPKILPDQQALQIRVTGEALFLNLGGGRNLVVTLTDSGSGRPFKRVNISQTYQFEDLWKSSGARSAAALPHIAFQLHMASKKTGADLKAARKKGKIELPIDRLPTAVTFTDLADPTTVKLVNPTDLAATFGPGYRIAKATIEVTDEPLTRGIEKKLPWLNNMKRYLRDPSNPFTSTLPDLCRRTNFIAKDSPQ